MMQKISVVCAVLAAVCLSACARLAASELTYKFKQGETLEYAVKEKIYTTDTVLGKNPNSVWEGVLAFTVNKLNQDGTAEVSAHYTNGTLQVFGSKRTIEPEQLGRHDLLISKQGEILNFSELDEENCLIDIPINAGDMGQQYAVEVCKSVLASTFQPLPKSGGHKWQQHVVFGVPFVKVLADCEVIQQSGSVFGISKAIDKKTAAPIILKEAGAGVYSDFTGSGNYQFDSKSGRILSHSATESLVFRSSIYKGTTTKPEKTTRIINISLLKG